MPEACSASNGENNDDFNPHADSDDRFIEPEEVVDIMERMLRVAKGNAGALIKVHSSFCFLNGRIE